jgi:ankyrin repeat protein
MSHLLHECISKNRYDEFIRLYKGHDVIWCSSSIIHSAAKCRNVAFTTFLLKQGFDPLIVNEWGNTPLHLAAKLDNVDVLDLLIKSGGMNDNVNNGSHTPLADAFAVSPACAQRLLDAGAKFKNVHNMFIFEWGVEMVQKQNNTKHAIVAFMAASKRTKRVHKDLVYTIVCRVWETRSNDIWLIQKDIKKRD